MDKSTNQMENKPFKQQCVRIGYLSNHFTRSDHKHSNRTSTSGSVNIPTLRTVQCQRSFGSTCSKDFNSLPLHVKSIHILNVNPKSISATCCVMNIKCHINQIIIIIIIIYFIYTLFPEKKQCVYSGTILIYKLRTL